MEQIGELETRNLEKLGAVERREAEGKRSWALGVHTCWKSGTVCVLVCSKQVSESEVFLLVLYYSRIKVFFKMLTAF